MITLGCITLAIFLMRFLLFNFRESPKFLLAKGHDIHALDVLHSVAAFNKRPPPKLSIDDFKALEFEETQKTSAQSATPLIDGSAGGVDGTPVRSGSLLKRVVVGGYKTMFGHLKGLFSDKIYIYLFTVLAVAWVLTGGVTIHH